MGAYVKLLEYDNIDGMILLSELSRRRIRSIQKLIRIGRNEVVVVLRVDKEKGNFPRSSHVRERRLIYYVCKVILICRNEECQPKTLSSAKNDTTRANRFTP